MKGNVCISKSWTKMKSRAFFFFSFFFFLANAFNLVTKELINAKIDRSVKSYVSITGIAYN